MTIFLALPLNSMSPHTKFVKPMKTLIEEQAQNDNQDQLNEEEEENFNIIQNCQ